MTSTSHVLFLCVHNAGRSQMALGWLDYLAGGIVVGASGGSEPAESINPIAIEAMAEVGIDIARVTPRRWSDLDLEEAAVVVTMGCGDACPYIPGKTYEDWPIDDPAGQPIETVRIIRDAIRARVEHLIRQLGAQ